MVTAEFPTHWPINSVHIKQMGNRDSNLQNITTLQQQCRKWSELITVRRLNKGVYRASSHPTPRSHNCLRPHPTIVCLPIPNVIHILPNPAVQNKVQRLNKESTVIHARPPPGPATIVCVLSLPDSRTLLHLLSFVPRGNNTHNHPHHRAPFYLL